MATRDRYTLQINCPNCKTKGVLHMSENDYQHMTKIDRCIDKIEGDFNVSINEENDRIQVKCRQCKTEFYG